MPQDSFATTPLVLQTVQDAVVERLRALILSRQLQPGQRLVQADLAEQLGVSRTPIRDALTRLAHEGLVNLTSYKSATVACFSAADLEEIFAVRIGLESYAAFVAARHVADAELEGLEVLLHEMAQAFEQDDFEALLTAHYRFHADIYAAARKQRLHDLIIKHMDLATVYQRMALSMGRGARDPVVEHQDLLDVLRRRDAGAAGAMLRAHLEMTAAELLELFREQPSGC
ncbi:MAG: GntR family transcriptional regulator [Anaerolineae bacterium]|jgi:DNA-binding GntR family transcriptional regulator|nr:GntR family transcriptional regulator [Anaerolineae bacterium]MDX9828742.1 GntR family transcriptional regulator [Anaerolineae bacterium]